ncbi:uncharacterized protein E5676_scaffold494G00580 [Cucumis melo var. makuwa]|uniref:Uncharacterized protein n=1 Tax=Cucumis melo var. makuwa TaxID=1194695 RepID=A0A5D3DDX1_CUCMM|nr:uncharacterized protein E5676_scaffold494G00580 [Cucumis melo var. makuwa]
MSKSSAESTDIVRGEQCRSASHHLSRYATSLDCKECDKAWTGVGLLRHAMRNTRGNEARDKPVHEAQKDRLVELEEYMLYLFKAPDSIRYLESRLEKISEKIDIIDSVAGRVEGLLIQENETTDVNTRLNLAMPAMANQVLIRGAVPITKYFKATNTVTEEAKVTLSMMYLCEDAKLWWRGRGQTSKTPLGEEFKKNEGHEFRYPTFRRTSETNGDKVGRMEKPCRLYGCKDGRHRCSTGMEFLLEHQLAYVLADAKEDRPWDRVDVRGKSAYKECLSHDATGVSCTSETVKEIVRLRGKRKIVATCDERISKSVIELRSCPEMANSNGHFTDGFLQRGTSSLIELLKEEDIYWSGKLECQAVLNGLKQATIEGPSFGVVNVTKPPKVEAEHSVLSPFTDGPYVGNNPPVHKVQKKREQMADITRVCLEEASRLIEERVDQKRCPIEFEWMTKLSINGATTLCDYLSTWNRKNIKEPKKPLLTE